MTDSVPVFPPLWRAFDDSGNLVASGYLRFKAAGSASNLTVYSDNDLLTSLGYQVALNSSGEPVTAGNTPTMIYTGTADYKVELYSSAGVKLKEFDGLRGATISPVAATVALPTTPVISRTSAYTVLSTDRAKLINADPSGGSFAVTLPSAVTVGDGFRVSVRHNGASTTNVVMVRSTGSQTISVSGQTTSTSIILAGLGHAVTLVSDGAGWNVDSQAPPLFDAGMPLVSITDRLTAPPGSPTGGQTYIITGTPTGAWASFAEHNIVRSDGNGGWHRYSPRAGWLAFVVDEDLYTKFDGTVWDDQRGMQTAILPSLKVAVFEHQETSGNGGGTNTNGSWATRTITTEVRDTIGMSVSANVITIPVGTYLVKAEQTIYHDFGTLGGRSVAQQRIASGTAAFDALTHGMPMRAGGVASGSGITFNSVHTHLLSDTFILNVTTAGTIRLEYHTNQATSTFGLGYPGSNGTEVYARLTFTLLGLNA